MYTYTKNFVTAISLLFLFFVVVVVTILLSAQNLHEPLDRYVAFKGIKCRPQNKFCRAYIYMCIREFSHYTAVDPFRFAIINMMCGV